MTDGAEEAPASRRWRLWDWLLLVGVLLVAGGIRLTHIDPVLSFDEIWHLAITQGYGSPLMNYEWDKIHYNVGHMTSLEHAAPVLAIWQDMREVLHPPGFMIVLRLWRELVGESDFAAHLLSIVASLIGIGFTFATAKLAMDRWAALVCGLAVACCQTQVYFAQEVRAYGVLIALASISLWIMTCCELLGCTRRRLLCLAFLSLAMLLTHYFAFGAAVGIGIYCLIRGGTHRRAFIIATVACALFYIVAWVPFALRQIRDLGTTDSMMRLPERDLVFTTLMLAGAPFRLIADRDYHVEFLTVFSGVLFLVPWMLVRRFKPLLPWVIWLSCSIAVIFLLDVIRTTRQAEYVRYLAVASPSVPLLYVGTCWVFRKSLAYIVGIVISFGGLMYLISRNTVFLDAQPFPQTASVLSRNATPGEPVLSFEGFPPAQWRAPVVIMVAAHAPNVFPRTMALLSKPMTNDMVAQLNARTAWLIVTYDQEPTVIVPGSRVLKTYYGDENLMIHHLAIGTPATSTAVESEGSRGAAEPLK